jgi:hypothetical protein
MTDTGVVVDLAKSWLPADSRSATGSGQRQVRES